METQYLAGFRRPRRFVATSVSQPALNALKTYLFPQLSVRLGDDCTQAIVTSTKSDLCGSLRPRMSVDCYRSIVRCLRASKCLPRSQWLQQLLHVAVLTKQKKSLLLSTLSPSALSRSTPVNTSKLGLGRASRPVPYLPAPTVQEVPVC